MTRVSQAVELTQLSSSNQTLTSNTNALNTEQSVALQSPILIAFLEKMEVPQDGVMPRIGEEQQPPPRDPPAPGPNQPRANGEALAVIRERQQNNINDLEQIYAGNCLGTLGYGILGLGLFIGGIALIKQLDYEGDYYDEAGNLCSDYQIENSDECLYYPDGKSIMIFLTATLLAFGACVGARNKCQRAEQADRQIWRIQQGGQDEAQPVRRRAPQNYQRNVHDNSVVTPLQRCCKALTELTPTAPSESKIKKSILSYFDTRSEKDMQFRKDMVAMAERIYWTPRTEAQRVNQVRKNVEYATNFMLSDKQPAMDYANYSTNQILRSLWTFLTKIQGDEEAPLSRKERDFKRLATENIYKQLFSASGTCNTGHMSRVLQGFTESLHVLRPNQPIIEIETPIMDASTYYDLHRNDLEQLLRDVFLEPETLSALHQLAGQSNGYRFKAKGTQIVRHAFMNKMAEALPKKNPALFEKNPNLVEELKNWFGHRNRFAIFIDNARNADAAANAESFSIRSFATLHSERLWYSERPNI